MSIIMPIVDEKGEFLAIIGADISLDHLQTEAANYKPLGGHVALVTGNGNYVANPDNPDSLGQPFGDSKQNERLWQQVQEKETLKGYTANSQGLNILRSFEPIQLPGGNASWYAVTSVKEEIIFSTYAHNRMISILMASFAMLMIGLLVTLLLRYIVLRHIRALVGKLQMMAEGDLTQKLEVKSGDEFGQLAQHFNVMTDKLRDMFQMVADLTMSIGATSEQLTASAEQTSQASEAIAASMQDTAEGAQTQNTHAEHTTTVMSEMALGVLRIAKSSAQVSESASGVAEQTADGSNRILQAVNQMGQAQLAVTDTERAIGRLSQRSEEIGNIIGIITSISSQTNLLALNASIEAARVGEQGKGFAVVASEVRKLAEQTQYAAEQVRGLIEAVRHDTAEAAAAMAQGSLEVEAGVKSVAESGKLFAAISSEMTDVNSQIQEVSASVQQISASAEQITTTTAQLAHIAQETSGNAHSVAAASEEQLASMEEIASSADALSHMVQELLDKMAQFKI